MFKIIRKEKWEKLQRACKEAEVWMQVVLAKITPTKPAPRSEAAQAERYRLAQEILQNEVFREEMNRLRKDLVDYIVKKADNWEEVRRARYFLGAYELLLQRLEEIPSPFQQEEKGGEFEAV